MASWRLLMIASLLLDAQYALLLYSLMRRESRTRRRHLYAPMVSVILAAVLHLAFAIYRG